MIISNLCCLLMELLFPISSWPSSQTPSRSPCWVLNFGTFVSASINVNLLQNKTPLESAADVFIWTLLDISLLWQLSFRLRPHLLADLLRLTRVFPVTGWEVPGSMELLRSVALAKSELVALLLLASALNLEWRWGWLPLCPGST